MTDDTGTNANADVDVKEFYRYTMTLNDLKNIIAHVESEGVPGDALVVLSKDGEGNWFAPLVGYGAEYIFVPWHDGGGDSESLKSWDNCEDETLNTEEAWRAHTLASSPLARQCVVLWPL